MTQTINWSALTSIQRDQLIAEKLFGWQPIPCDGELTIYDDGDAWCPGCQERDHISTIEHGIIAPPTYSTSMNAAWEVIKQVDDDATCDYERFLRSIATSYDNASDHFSSTEAIFSLSDLATLTPEKICLAALSAYRIEAKS